MSEPVTLQPGLQPAAPTDTNGAETAPGHQRWCSRPAEADGAQRCPECGCWQVSNQGARVHPRVPPTEAIPNADALFDGIVSDFGGSEQMTSRELSAAGKARDLDVVISLNKQAIVRNGLDSRAGAKAHERLMAAVDRWVRVVALLGPVSQRRQKRVQTASELIAGGER